MLVHVDFAESYRNDQQNEIKSTYFGNKNFSLFISCCYFNGVTSVVVVAKNSDQKRITRVV